ncbi:hypothetical protein IHE55_11065 [Streptomyces pactum]|uniref:Ig-like domain-containing protein n=1 Tax=Streptomyces pactum TaxID=68249 RepID=A0ABS0NJC6_9ACTN|nr:hypothetical protein [Streptomyces pactum]MBH5335303.1 hypothetical protein [Streptomyces pactum]
MQRRHQRICAAAVIGLLAVTGLTGCGGKKRGGGFPGADGGSAAGGADAPAGLPSDLDLPSALPSGLPTDLPSGYPSTTPTDGYTPPAPTYTTSAPPTYNPDATAETTTSNCSYGENDGMLRYSITVANTDSTRSFRYTLSVKWTKKSDGSYMGTDTQYVTVLPGSSQTVTASAYHRLDTYTYFTCSLTSATKMPVN